MRGMKLRAGVGRLVFAEAFYGVVSGSARSPGRPESTSIWRDESIRCVWLNGSTGCEWRLLTVEGFEWVAKSAESDAFSGERARRAALRAWI